MLDWCVTGNRHAFFIGEIKLTYYALHRKIDKEWFDAATELNSTRPYNDDSILEGKGNLVGLLAEMYVVDILCALTGPESVKYVDQFTHDVYWNGIKIDSKTKQRGSAPLFNHDASIAEHTVDKQKCDVYFFSSIKIIDEVPTDFYFMGYMSKKEYLAKARIMKKGDVDGGNKKSGGKIFTIAKDCRNLRYDELRTFDKSYAKTLKNYKIQLI